MSYSNPWIYNDKILESEHVQNYQGMVYLIENTENGKKYVGKKFFWKPKYRIVKGKKKRYKAESDWKDYYGSSKQLLEDIDSIGKDKFKRTVLKLCKNKSECAYYELVEQVERQVLLTDEYYNAFIGSKINGRNLR